MSSHQFNSTLIISIYIPNFRTCEREGLVVGRSPSSCSKRRIVVVRNAEQNAQLLLLPSLTRLSECGVKNQDYEQAHFIFCLNSGVLAVILWTCMARSHASLRTSASVSSDNSNAIKSGFPARNCFHNPASTEIDLEILA